MSDTSVTARTTKVSLPLNDLMSPHWIVLSCVDLSLVFSGVPDRKEEQERKKGLIYFLGGEAGRVAHWRSLKWALWCLPRSLSSPGSDVFSVNQVPPGGISIARGSPSVSLSVYLDSKKGFTAAASGQTFKNTKTTGRNLPSLILYPFMQRCPHLHGGALFTADSESWCCYPLPNQNSSGLKSLSEYSVRWAQRNTTNDLGGW